jgi:hypothetical protein
VKREELRGACERPASRGMPGAEAFGSFTSGVRLKVPPWLQSVARRRRPITERCRDRSREGVEIWRSANGGGGVVVALYVGTCAPPPLIAGQNDVRKFEWRGWWSLTDGQLALVPALKSRLLGNRWLPQTTYERCDVQAVLCRRRHQPRRPPLAKIRPGSHAPAMGDALGQRDYGA